MAKRKRHTEELKREAVRLMVGTWALGHLGTGSGARAARRVPAGVVSWNTDDQGQDGIDRSGKRTLSE